MAKEKLVAARNECWRKSRERKEADDEMAAARGMIRFLSKSPFNNCSGEGHTTVHWNASKFWDQRMDLP
jgi:hypothetical protein